MTDTGEVRGEIESCVLCETPVHLRPTTTDDPLIGHGVGHPMAEVFAHYVCPNDAIQERVRDLHRRLYEAESVLVALYRIENVPDSVLDDRAQYEKAWARWKASYFSHVGGGSNGTS